MKRGQARPHFELWMVVGGSQEVMEEKDEGEPFFYSPSVIELVWSRNDRTGFVYWVSFSSTTLFLGTK